MGNQVLQFQLKTSGKIQFQDFNASDDTTHENLSGTPTYTLDAANSILKISGSAVVGSAVYTITPADYVVGVRTMSTDALVARQDPIGRKSGGNFYGYRVDNQGDVVQLEKNYPATGIGGTTARTIPNNQWYVATLEIRGTTLRGLLVDVGAGAAYAVTDISNTDSSYSSAGKAGAEALLNSGASGYVAFDYIAVCTAPYQIQVLGLLDGQKIKLYAEGVLVGTSGPSAGQTLTYAPPWGIVFDRIEITDIDGVTPAGGISSYSLTRSIFIGDVYQALVTKSLVTNPDPPVPEDYVQCRVAMCTLKGAYDRFHDYRISPPGGGQVGQFRVIIPDITAEEESSLIGDTRVWFCGVVGLGFKQLLAGYVDLCTPKRLPGSKPVVDVTGYSAGGVSRRDGFAQRTNVQNKSPDDIIVNTIAPLSPRMQFGPQIYAPGFTLNYITYLNGRKVWDALVELAALSYASGKIWTTYDCQGEHPGERTQNWHFIPVSKTLSLVPLLTAANVHAASPSNYREIITKSIIHYTYTYNYDNTDEVFADSALCLKVDVTIPGNGYVAVDLTNVTDYVVQSGDFLEYEVFWASKYQRTAMELVCTDGSAMRADAPTDQNGVATHPATDLSQVAYLRWYTRRIRLPASWVGKTINQFYLWEWNSQQVQRCVSGFRNMRITDGAGAVRKWIWDGTGTITTSVSTSNYTLVSGYPKAEHPVYGIIPELEDQPWMTQSQATDYAKLRIRIAGDYSKFYQADVAPDGRFQYGVLLQCVDRRLWGVAELQSVELIGGDQHPRMQIRLAYPY